MALELARRGRRARRCLPHAATAAGRASTGEEAEARPAREGVVARLGGNR
eukprot:CAMPEP_0114494924 /NCGR_PEP_ID=MMETSP0109-20121206/4922_1 /TAXON_ID=29199 /ORGANISM="Chlorarachnion reptans, Strain CCCM449" /LENGTH=49 /DNA_ID= /DNA_START= /DNA_END= /DNA_ORIENTATION=